MKHQGSIEINQSVDKVAQYFADPAYLKEYQDGFLRKEQLSGTPGQAGAVAKMYYQMGKGEMELTETITKNETTPGI